MDSIPLPLLPSTQPTTRVADEGVLDSLLEVLEASSEVLEVGSEVLEVGSEVVKAGSALYKQKRQRATGGKQD